MRLIDADKLRFYLGSYFLIDPNELRFSQSCVFRMIDNMPTIEERKTGKWISLDDFRGKYNTCGYKCSECDEHSDYEENYCPNCGARMEI